MKFIPQFRQSNSYLKRFNCFGDALKIYAELEEDGKVDEGLEQLMLEAYRFMRFLRRSNNILGFETPRARPVATALFSLVALLDEPLSSRVPVYLEAEALEVFSYSAWLQLKRANKIKHCKHCKAYLFGNCKKHKVATTIENLFYCKGCKGWIESICVYHGSDACVSGDDEVF